MTSYAVQSSLVDHYYPPTPAQALHQDHLTYWSTPLQSVDLEHFS